MTRMTGAVLGFCVSKDKKRVMLTQERGVWTTFGGLVAPGRTFWEQINQEAIDFTGWEYQFPAFQSFGEIIDGYRHVLTMCYWVDTDLNDMEYPDGSNIPNFPVDQLPTPLAPFIAELISYIVAPHPEGRATLYDRSGYEASPTSD